MKHVAMKPVRQFNAWAIKPPQGWDDDFRPQDSVAYTDAGAWDKFCRPALKRSGYEADGFRPVPVVVVIMEHPDQA